MIKRFKRARALRRLERLSRVSQAVEDNSIGFTGNCDAQIRIINSENGVVLEYTWFPPAGSGGTVFHNPITSDNISRRIVPPEDYPKIGEIILQMHVTAAAKKARA